MKINLLNKVMIRKKMFYWRITTIVPSVSTENTGYIVWGALLVTFVSCSLFMWMKNFKLVQSFLNPNNILFILIKSQNASISRYSGRRMISTIILSYKILISRPTTLHYTGFRSLYSPNRVIIVDCRGWIWHW